LISQIFPINFFGVKNWTQNWIPSSIFLWTETETALIYFLIPKSEVFHTSQEPPNNGPESGHLGPLYTRSPGPMFNPNPAYLLVQKLKSAPQGLYTRSQKLKSTTKTFQSAPSY
jgi:hypothetical protein